MNQSEYAYEILEALGDETLGTGEILPKLKLWNPTRRELSGFINGYMVNRFVEKIRNHKGSQRRVTFKAIVI